MSWEKIFSIVAKLKQEKMPSENLKERNLKKQFLLKVVRKCFFF